MQNVDNHMDDLFRKAAENYPLKTSNGDWGTLQSLLENEPSNVSTKGTRRKPFFLFVAFVFLLIGLMTFGILKNNGVAIKIAEGGANINGSVIALSGNAINTADENIDNHALENKRIEKKQLKPGKGINNPRKSGGLVLPIYQKKNIFENQTDIKDERNVPNKNVDSNSLKPKENNRLLVSNPLPEQNISSPNIKTDTSSLIDTSFIENKKEKIISLKIKSKSRLYFSVSSGVEYGQVKSQGITRPGWNAGLFAGVQFTKNISIETGLQLSQKKYFSSGLYFKPKSGSMPSDMVISSLNGNSVLIELPFNLKYNLQNRNNTFYLMTGISSFLMTTESNHYFAVISGAQTEVNGKYQQMHSYFASMINVGAGYQFGLNKKSNLRVEPYLQLPLRGMGIGSMPVMATGLHFIWSRR